MNKKIKYALFFISGATVGAGIATIKMVKYALCDDYLCEALSRKVSDYIFKELFQNETHNRSRVSYKHYYENK